MIHYSLGSPVPSSRYIRVEARFDISEERSLELQLPSWRPGRYELGNFAKNLRGLTAVDSEGRPLSVTKTVKDRWIIKEAPRGIVTLSYEYYAAQADAGACWVDHELFYFNPVHCIIYDTDRLWDQVQVRLELPDGWQIATALPVSGKNTLLADDIHHLLDSPVMASRALRHRTYSVHDYQFHIWIHGECKPDWTRILKDFEAFTRVQLQTMGSFPVPEFHFLILLLPYPFYHGVEHTASTVLALGPGYDLMKPSMYSDLMGVASHELFHVWNVKTLRPADFLEYDYTRENYSRLGWVYEGFTTYYGDLYLSRSGFFNLQEFFAELNVRLQRHADAQGCHYSSVAESSFDTWLDGYVPGAPARKTSIYDEGCLVALMLDLYIRRASAGRSSLDDLFVHLYGDFGVRGKGYVESDLHRLAEYFSDHGVARIFVEAIHARDSYISLLGELLPVVGCMLSIKPSPLTHERCYGFRTVQEGGITRVAAVLPDSPAEQAGISRDDELLACNGWKVEGNLSDLVNLSENECELIVSSQKKITTVKPGIQARTWYDRVAIVRMTDVESQAKAGFEKWSGQQW